MFSFTICSLQTLREAMWMAPQESTGCKCVQLLLIILILRCLLSCLFSFFTICLTFFWEVKKHGNICFLCPMLNILCVSVRLGDYIFLREASLIQSTTYFCQWWHFHLSRRFEDQSKDKTLNWDKKGYWLLLSNNNFLLSPIYWSNYLFLIASTSTLVLILYDYILKNTFRLNQNVTVL